MNAPAIELYRAHNIDIAREMLEVRVCAQHHNGGVAVDSDWQTCVPGLYACGECAGTFGMYRPGGSALNSTQVGSMRAAEHIARVSKRTAAQTSAPFAAPLLPCGDVPALTAHAQAQMTLHAAFLRDSDGMRAWQDEIGSILQNSAPAQESDEFLVRRLQGADAARRRRAGDDRKRTGADDAARRIPARQRGHAHMARSDRRYPR